jgi:phospholipid/cholesterol/gamma-HCH transport system substrate-binding protein
MTGRRGIATKVVALGLAGAMLTGCSAVSLQGVPLPGGADLGSDPYQVTVQLRDALDLVPQSAVRANNVAVGQVKAVELDAKDWYANVIVQINGGVKLPANAVAELKQTTLLGEKYIELNVPKDQPAQGELNDGSVIPVARTGRFPEAEEIFGSLSLLLNGGGIGQVQNISQELNKALGGRTGDAKALLTDLNTLVSTLDGQRFNVTKALDGVNNLSIRLAQQRNDLDSVLTDLEPGLKVLSEQRPQLVGLLKSLDRLSDTATHVVEESHDDVVKDLELLGPVLRELANAGDALPKSLEVLATPPFTDAAIKPSANRALNLDFQLNIDLVNLIVSLVIQALLNGQPLPPGLPLPPGFPIAGANTLPGPINNLPVAPLKDPLSKLPAPGGPSAPKLPLQLPKAPEKPNVPGLGGN